MVELGGKKDREEKNNKTEVPTLRVLCFGPARDALS